MNYPKPCSRIIHKEGSNTCQRCNITIEKVENGKWRHRVSTPKRKPCITCKQVKPSHRFHTRKDAFDGLAGTCKLCKRGGITQDQVSTLVHLIGKDLARSVQALCKARSESFDVFLERALRAECERRYDELRRSELLRSVNQNHAKAFVNG